MTRSANFDLFFMPHEIARQIIVHFENNCLFFVKTTVARDSGEHPRNISANVSHV